MGFGKSEERSLPQSYRNQQSVENFEINSASGTFYRRLRSRLGTPKAITATAHKLARIFYRLWTNGGKYQDPGMDYYEQRYQERVINNLQKKALALGFELTPQPQANTVS
ncbi:hypothetical protein [Nostoc sp. FACHB-892]|uniref:hypothetical protein n=1 Tax=Nostoc sp. FACHB-892 TaxID=2692843 RepID=UPI0018EFD72C|nr:hypothetical protein [Nostoc sp. FACHB-892]